MNFSNWDEAMRALNMLEEHAHGHIVLDGRDIFLFTKTIRAVLNQPPPEWREAVQEFVNRCERGEVKSRYTYAKFKQLLDDLPAEDQIDERMSDE